MQSDSPTRLIDPDLASRRAEVLKALGNSVRLRIVACLSGERELTVGDLAARLNVPQSSVSRQLGWLRLAGLVAARQEGGFRHYAIAMPQVTNLLQCLTHCCRDEGETQA